MLIKEQIRKVCFISRTSFGTEAEAFVRVVVLCRGAPAVAIVPASRGAPVILLSLKGEWEFARSPVGVTPQGEEHCKKKKIDKYRHNIQNITAISITLRWRSFTTVVIHAKRACRVKM